MRYNLKFFIFLLIPFFLSSVIYSDSEKKNFANALKRGNSEYFQSISLEKWKAGNKPSKAQTPIQKYGIRSIPALSGGIINPNVDVRKAVYKELLFPSYFSSLGENPQRVMSRDKETKQYLDMIREKILAQTESDPEAESLQIQALQFYNYSLREAINIKNPRAIAYMSPDFFDKSNAEHEKTVIGRFGKRSVRTLVRALAVEKGDIKTKLKILDALMFTQMGGPEKVIPKMSIRAKRAEELFLIADRLSDKSSLQEFRLKLLDVASAYIETSFEMEGKAN
jgi:hypothetical protein